MYKNNKGFTLIELLIALALLTVLTGALYGTYFSVTTAMETGRGRAAQRRGISTTLAVLRNEINSAYYQPHTPGAPHQGAQFNNPEENVQFVVEDRDSYGKPTSLLQLTTLTAPHSGPKPASDVAATRYCVRETGNTLTLTRESKDLYLQGKSTPYPVIDDIAGFLVECYDGSAWVKTWDTALTSRLPEQVRVTVTLAKGDKFTILATPGLARKPAAAAGNGAGASQ